MLYQFSGDGDRPTYFEMVAAEQLPGSLKAAVLYVVGVLAQRVPRLHALLDYGEESLAALMLLLEWHNLRTHDASFGESLFGLRRERYLPQGAGVRLSQSMAVSKVRTKPSQASAEASTDKRIRSRDRLLSLIFLVGVPYLKAKCHTAYVEQRQQALTSSLWGDDSDERSRQWAGSRSWSEWLRGSGRAGLRQPLMEHPRSGALWQGLGNLGMGLYPWFHAQYEGLLFMYQLLYMLDATAFYLPSLHYLRLRVRRSTPEEFTQAHNQVESRRTAEFSRITGPAWFRASASTVLRYAYTALDYSQTGIIAAVFLFKMLEWWYQSGEQRLLAPAVFPPPPPPPAPKPARGGLPLPADKRLCPLCLKLRTNPTIAAVSGYAFCYPCIFAYVDEYKRCPITHFQTDVRQLRRLFLNT